MHRLL